MLNRLVGGGGSPGVGGFEGGGDSEGEGECNGGSGRVLRTIGGGGPLGDLPGLDGEWFDRGGGGGGGDGFDPGPRFLEEWLCTS